MVTWLSNFDTTFLSITDMPFETIWPSKFYLLVLAPYNVFGWQLKIHTTRAASIEALNTITLWNPAPIFYFYKLMLEIEWLNKLCSKSIHFLPDGQKHILMLSSEFSSFLGKNCKKRNVSKFGTFLHHPIHVVYTNIMYVCSMCVQDLTYWGDFRGNI